MDIVANINIQAIALPSLLLVLDETTNPKL